MMQRHAGRWEPWDRAASPAVPSGALAPSWLAPALPWHPTEVAAPHQPLIAVVLGDLLHA